MSGLRALADDLWCAEAEIAVARMPLGVRMTVLRRPGGGLILHSPIEIDDALADAIDALGPVEHLIAPNRFHHLFLLGATRRWPEARLWGAPGLPAKRRDLVFDEVLGDDTPEQLADCIELRLIAGAPIVSEVALFHPPSRTLVLTDFVFNIQRSSSRVSRLYLRLSGAWQRLAQTPLTRMLVRDRAAARRSLKAVFEWDFDRLIVAHGDIVEHGGKRRLADALAKLGRFA